MLLIITLMFPLGALLATRNINISTQVQSTEAYNSAVAMAEMGIPRAEAELRYALKNSTTEIEDILENAPNNPEDIIHELGTLVARKANTRLANPLTFSDDSLSTNLEIELKETTAEQMVFEVISIGTSDIDYEITAEIAIAVTLSVSDDESGGGDDSQQVGDFDDPSDFPDSQSLDRDIRAQVVFPDISGSQAGGTFSDEHHFDNVAFHSNVNLTNGARFFVNGHMRGNGLTINGANEFNVGETLLIQGHSTMTDINSATVESHASFSGGPDLTRSTFHVGGTLISNGGATINASTLHINESYTLPSTLNINNGSHYTVEGDTSNLSTINISNSTANFKGQSAFNSLSISGSNNPGVQTGNLRAGSFTLNNSDLIANGGAHFDWGFNIGPNSNLTVRGHMSTNAQKTIGANSTLIVYGDLTFASAGWNTILFNGNGSRIIIYGEALNGTASINSANVRNVETLEQCPPENNTNIICFISGNPPGGGQGTIPENPQTPEFDWNSDFKLQEIIYQGIKRS